VTGYSGYKKLETPSGLFPNTLTVRCFKRFESFGLFLSQCKLIFTGFLSEAEHPSKWEALVGWDHLAQKRSCASTTLWSVLPLSTALGKLSPW